MSNALPARDQSMDEILASIRRIIETGDERLARNTVAVRAVASPVAEQPAAAEPAPMSRPMAVIEAMPAMAPQADEIAEARADHLSSAPAVEAASPVELARPDSSPVGEASRISANAPRSIRRAAPAAAEAMAEWPQAVAANDRYGEIAAEMFVDEFDEAGFAEELMRGAVGEEEPEIAATDDNDMADPEDAPYRMNVGASFDVAERSPAAYSEDASFDVARALISQEAGERVAASFSDLASAIRDEHLRDVDVVVREMLRPMLQEWLDENLPRVVELLVREEIERIARGSTR
ncbi:DUF2497 domain-containing protein [Jiella sp. MQZ9-1]|uniref:DUF2497 domain-containing protein n=1 Tax=Jiella flava TaxID=2816857 RepID=A0A939JXU2_9HYPH|nr:DUF2497 domain-containing protein [Jiella flava]MBO0664447.1 DUF2497 domain-containing protein [Jiella flava]MCD2473083.1 DUF2497 domain-containing protein [Jiella flava]